MQRNDSSNEAKRLYLWSEATLVGWWWCPPGLPPVPNSLILLDLKNTPVTPLENSDISPRADYSTLQSLMFNAYLI